MALTLGPFAEIVNRPKVLQLILLGLVARLPHAAASILLTLHVVQTLGLGYAQSGIVAAAVTVGIAIGAPWRGKRIDLVGLRRALLPSIFAEIAVWTAAPFVPFWALVPLAFVGGVLSLPVFSLVRQSLGVQTAGEVRRTAYTTDSMATEVVFMIGPAVAVMIASSFSTAVGLVGVGVAAALAGVGLMVLNPPTRSAQVHRSDAEIEEDLAFSLAATVAAAPANLQDMAGEASSVGQRLGRRRMRQRLAQGRDRHLPWLTLPTLAVLVIAFASSITLVGTEVSVVAALRASGNTESLGLVFFFWCASSLIGGLLYTLYGKPISPMLLLIGMAVTVPLVALAHTPWQLAWLTVPTGLFCAPVLSSASERMSDLVPEEVRGEAMGWYGSALTLGTALGSPLVGLMIDAGHPVAGYFLPAVIGTVVGLFALFAQQQRRRRLRTER